MRECIQHFSNRTCRRKATGLLGLKLRSACLSFQQPSACFPQVLGDLPSWMSQQQVSALVLSAVSIASHFGFLFPTLLPDLETLFPFLFTLPWSQTKQWTKGKRQCLEDSVCNRPSPFIQPQPRCWFCLGFIFPNFVVHTKWSYEFWFWLPWSVYRAVYAYLRSNAPRSHFLVPPKGFARL